MSHQDVAGPAGQRDPRKSPVPAGRPRWSSGPGERRGGCAPFRGLLRLWLAGALSTACDGELSAREILDSGNSFVAMGITSIATIRLVDLIEAELDVMIDFGGDTWFLQDLNALTAYLTDLTRS